MAESLKQWRGNGGLDQLFFCKLIYYNNPATTVQCTHTLSSIIKNYLYIQNTAHYLLHAAKYCTVPVYLTHAAIYCT